MDLVEVCFILAMVFAGLYELGMGRVDVIGKGAILFALCFLIGMIFEVIEQKKQKEKKK